MFDTREPCDAERRARLHAQLDLVLDTDRTAPGSVLSAAIEAAADLTTVAEGRMVSVLKPWNDSGDWAHDGSPTPSAWLRTHTGRSRAACGWVRKTGIEAAGMPHVLAAAEAGLLGEAHLALLVRARRDPVCDLFDRDEAHLVELACTLSIDALKTVLRRWWLAALEDLGANDPDINPDRHGPEHLTITPAYQGTGVVNGELSPTHAAMVTESLETIIERWRKEGLLDGDTRTQAQLYAAALVELATGGPAPSRRPLIMATAPLTTLFDLADTPAQDRFARRAEIIGGGPVATDTIRRLLEDADLRIVITDDDGEPLYVGRQHRYATTAQHCALVVRTGCRCQWPGCSAHRNLIAHHITWWDNHGPTDLDNLFYLCRYHHRLLHRLGYQISGPPQDAQVCTPTGEPITVRYGPAP